MSDLSEDKSQIFVLSKNKRKETKRRYLLCQNNKQGKRPMMDHEVETEYKLKTFLADVENYSEKLKHQKEEKLGKAHFSNKDKDKRGLFENGMLSKASVKEILSLKNKARLSGNLENLLNENQNKSISDIECSEENTSLLNGRDWCTEEGNKALNYSPEIPKTEKNTIKRSSYNKEPGIGDFIKFAEKRAEECMNKLKKTIGSNLPQESRDGLLLDYRQSLIDILQKKFIKKALTDEGSLLKNIKTVCEKYMLSMKPTMADKSVQTECPDKFETMEWNDEQPAHLSNEGNQTKNLHKLKMNQGNKTEEPFTFCPKNLSGQLISPDSPARKTCFPIVTPQGVKAECWPPIAKKPDTSSYVPSILFPPSPGRKYSISPEIHEQSRTSEQLPKKFSKIIDFSLDVIQTPTINSCFAPRKKKEAYFAEATTSKYKQIIQDTSRHNSKSILSIHPSLPQDNEFYFSDFKSVLPLKRRSSFSSLSSHEEIIDVTSISNIFPKRLRPSFSPHRY